MCITFNNVFEIKDIIYINNLPNPMKTNLVIQFFLGMRDEVFSDYNRWITSEKVGHNAGVLELWVHYIVSGGRSRYRECFFQNHPFSLEDFHQSFVCKSRLS